MFIAKAASQQKKRRKGVEEKGVDSEHDLKKRRRKKGRGSFYLILFIGREARIAPIGANAQEQRG